MNTDQKELGKELLSPSGELLSTTISVFIRATIPKSFVLLRKFLPRRNAKSKKTSFSISVFFVFSCGYHLRRQPRWVHLWFPFSSPIPTARFRSAIGRRWGR